MSSLPGNPVWSGPKDVRGYTPQILAEMLHPDDFPPLHEGAVWRRLAI